MPCYTARTITTEMSAAHPDVLARALRAGGFEARLSEDAKTVLILRGGTEVARLAGKELTGTSLETLGQIKNAYTDEAIRTAARKHGLTIKEDTKTATFTLTRRTL